MRGRLQVTTMLLLLHMPGRAGWATLGLLIIVLVLISLLISVVHAKTDDPANRLCNVIRAVRGLPAEPGAAGKQPLKGTGTRKQPAAPVTGSPAGHPAARGAGQPRKSRPAARRRSSRSPQPAKPGHPFAKSGR